MSFLKISDPLKRDAIVKEYLELKKNIRDNLLSERIGEQQLQTDLSKFYKPITETQKATTVSMYYMAENGKNFTLFKRFKRLFQLFQFPQLP